MLLICLLSFTCTEKGGEKPKKTEEQPTAQREERKKERKSN
jgi:hypothetical protein